MPYEVLSRVFVLCSCDYCPLQLPYGETNVPCQVVLSQVCSKWRQIALSTGALWCQVTISYYYYAISLSLYRTWIDRAGPHPLTVTLKLPVDDCSDDIDVCAVFLDFVLPFQIKTLCIVLKYEDLQKLSIFPILDVEEVVISLMEIQSTEILAPPFINKTRRINLEYYLDSRAPGELWFQEMLKGLCLPWHDLRSLECNGWPGAPLTSVLNILQQVPSLENFRVYISSIGSGQVVGVSMPNLRSLALSVAGVKLNIVIPLFTTPNLTSLRIQCSDTWPPDTYDVIRKHHKLLQLEKLQLYSESYPFRIAQILMDAPMIRKLGIDGEPVLDAEVLEDITSRRLGRYLSSLYICGYPCIEKWLDAMEARRRNERSMFTQARQMITGLKEVGLRQLKDWVHYLALKALGTIIHIINE